MQGIRVKWNVNPNTVRRITDSYIKRSLTDVEENLSLFAEIASEHIRRESILKDSATGTAWHRNANAQRGNQYGARFDTGQMSKNVGFIPADEIQDGESTAEFGLFTGGEEYFLRQEFGFKLQMKNGFRKVRGMHSAEKAIKYTKPIFRKLMLSDGFLRGRVDTRGTRVVNLMGEGKSFDAAWRESAPERTEQQRQAYDKYRMLVAESAVRKANMDLKWSQNRRVIDALQFGKDYSEQVYRQTVEDLNRRKGNR